MGKLLLGYVLDGETIGVDITTWNSADLNGNDAFISIEDTEAIPSNYANISSILNWDNFGIQAGLKISEVKNEIQKIQPENLESLTTEESEVFDVLSIGNNRYYKQKENIETTTSLSTLYDELEVDIEEGTFELSVTFLFTINSTNKSFHYNVMIDGTPIYNIDPISIEFKDITNKRIVTLSKDLVLTTGTHTIRLMYGTEGKSTSTIYYSNIKLSKIE